MINEAAIDGGGPSREYFELVCEEVVSKTKLFIPSPNGVHGVGEEREKLVPNPNAVSKTDMSNFFKVGLFIGFSLLSKQCINLSLPSIFWRYLLGRDIEWKDLKTIDLNIVHCIDRIMRMSPDDIEVLEQPFITYLSDGCEIELKRKSENMKVTSENRQEYFQLAKKVLLERICSPFESIRKGFYTVVPIWNLQGASAKRLEQLVCGSDYVG